MECGTFLPFFQLRFLFTILWKFFYITSAKYFLFFASLFIIFGL